MESKEKPVASSDKWRQVIPNALTIVRIILVPVFIALMIIQHLRGSVSLLIVSLVVFCIASYTDHLDGKLARRWQVVSDFGKLVDPIADKALMISAFVLLSLFQSLWWWFTAVVILREVAVTLLRMYLLRSGVVLPASKGGKIKTSLQILMVFLWMLAGICYPFNVQLGIIIMYLAIAVLIAAFVATVLSGMVYFLDAHDNHKKSGEAADSADKDSVAEPHAVEKDAVADAETDAVELGEAEENGSVAEPHAVEKDAVADAETDAVELGEAEEDDAPEDPEEKTSATAPTSAEAGSDQESGDEAEGLKKIWKPLFKRASWQTQSKDQETEESLPADSPEPEPEETGSQDLSEDAPAAATPDTPVNTSDKDAKDTEKENKGVHHTPFPSRRARRAQQARKAEFSDTDLDGKKSDSAAHSWNRHSRVSIPDLSAASASPVPSTTSESADESPES